MDLNAGPLAVQPLRQAFLFAVTGVAAFGQPAEEPGIGDLVEGSTSSTAVPEIVDPLMCVFLPGQQPGGKPALQGWANRWASWKLGSTVKPSRVPSSRSASTLTGSEYT